MPEPDLLQIYLIVANVAALAVGLLDARARRRGGGISPFVLSAFSFLGGAACILATSLSNERRTRKENVPQRFWAVWSVLAWALALAYVYGALRYDPSTLVANLHTDHTPLAVYLAAINLLTFVLFLLDKRRARRNAWRIREGVLLGLALLGGSAGGLLGMALAHHKVNTPYFRMGLPCALLLNLAIVASLLQAGLC